MTVNITTPAATDSLNATATNGPRRVLILINSLWRGGGERDAAMFCKHMDRSRYVPEVWTLLEGGEFQQTVTDAGVKVRCLGRRKAYSPFFAWRAAGQIARADVDLIHIFQPAIGFYSAVAKTFRGALQPLIYYEMTSVYNQPRIVPLYRWMQKRCDGFMANSDTSADNLVQPGIRSDSIRIIPNGHEIARYHSLEDRESLRRSIGVAPDETLALFVGRLIPTKRVCDLVDAVVQLDAVGRRLRVVIVGEGPEMEPIKQQIASKRLGETISLLGLRTDVPNLLQAADLFLFPSEVEGLSNSIIEAALTGLPMVACDIGGVREVVDDGANALLVPPRSPQEFAHAIEDILDNPQQAADRAAIAQEFAENQYTIEASVQKLCDLYDEVLAARS